jgi:DNA polymerase III subunit delta'
MVEEPPARSVFLIIAHQPRRVLPTIRSRSRKLDLRELSSGQTIEVMRGLDVPNPDHETARAAGLGQGSVRRALMRLDPETAALIEGTRDMLARLPAYEIPAVLALADSLAGKAADEDFGVFMETVEDWMSAQIGEHAGHGAHRLAPLAQVWEKTGRSARETDVLNLDRRPLVLSIFTDLADAVTRMRMG